MSWVSRWAATNFYPRPPRGGRPSQQLLQKFPTDFYPRPPRGGRPYNPDNTPAYAPISTHALREEGDGCC